MDRVHEVTREAFSVLNQLRQLDPELRPHPEQLHRRMCGLIDGLKRRATEAGFSAVDADEMAYAIVALADEIALEQPGPLRDFWMSRSLQLVYFRENVAGEGFFARLGKLQGDPRRGDVVRVYLLCLLFGFRGKYRVRGGEVELLEITESLTQILIRQGGPVAEVLSPHGDRPEEARKGKRKSLPLVGVACGILAIAVGSYIVMKSWINTDGTAVLDRITELNKARE